MLYFLFRDRLHEIVTGAQVKCLYGIIAITRAENNVAAWIFGLYALCQLHPIHVADFYIQKGDIHLHLGQDRKGVVGVVKRYDFRLRQNLPDAVC